VTAPADWMTERPPLPQRVKPYVGRHRAKDWDDTDVVWPPVDQDFPAVSGILFDEPTVRFRPVKPRRWSRQWLRENLSLSRVVWGGFSAVVLLATGLGRWFL
jgi:hypothetical protein